MIYSKKYIEQYSNETGFIKNYIEKVVRLIDVLNYIFSESSFKDKLILKGGTAINLVYTKLKRLSVDIDLDYCGSLDKETALRDRVALEEELDKYMAKENYQISQNSRSSFALFSRIYRFKNAFGGNDTIKVDINFMNRVHLYPSTISTVTYFGKTVTLITPAIEELFGMKINALIDRSKPRDLYDTVFIAENTNLFDKDLLRKAIVFYLPLNNIFNFDCSSFNRINLIGTREVKRELQPVLKKDELFKLDDGKNITIDLLNKMLDLTDKEKQYLTIFANGQFVPSLLFNGPIDKKIEQHPMAKWRITNIKK